MAGPNVVGQWIEIKRPRTAASSGVTSPCPRRARGPARAVPGNFGINAYIARSPITTPRRATWCWRPICFWRLDKNVELGYNRG